ncbi:uncharacterized protein LOC115629168 isoform X1 [Scaptodrosophila lebanonensis]|uniref:Uncharacterized protein LOC115629168 isoform X1 n=1 Tax=Drosophila lebanonensis TaxID=7225 RepID=A0A6J2U0H6_DROLE|nr:uncharacterized protein LOC115629168 isoform X1 [Scaptodrosophila lebanonensis]
MPKQKKTALTSVEKYELDAWLQEHNINPNNLRRSFTDVLPLARLLSRLYPELVDVNHYPPRNSVQSKISNWTLFNKRVLERLGVRITREEMDRVARSVPGSIDLLLFSIMRAHMETVGKRKEQRQLRHEENTGDSAASDDDKTSQQDDIDKPEETMTTDDLNTSLAPVASGNEVVEARPQMLRSHIADTGLNSPERSLNKTEMTRGGSDSGVSAKQRSGTPQARRNPSKNEKNREAVMVNVRKQIGDLVCEIPQKMVLYSVYAQAVDQLRHKRAKIAQCDQRNAHLENMLQLKTEHIDELQNQIHHARLHQWVMPPMVETLQGRAEGGQDGMVTKGQV